jgi:cold shock CspA family protein
VSSGSLRTDHGPDQEPLEVRRPRSGSVTGFDDPRGWGEVTGTDGRVFPFHCTAITDGSRTIDVGTPVTFVVAAGHGGHLEARSVEP